jgi:hypothetical protein
MLGFETSKENWSLKRPHIQKNLKEIAISVNIQIIA